MHTITRVGVNLAKYLIQVHAVDAAGKVDTNRALKREKFLLWCADLPYARGEPILRMTGVDGQYASAGFALP